MIGRSRRVSPFLPTFLLLWAGSAVPVHAEDAADGRRHAQRASQLAAKGKCRQAVAAYDKAIAVIRDATLLFNRGECHRRLGAHQAAIDDYKQFLADLPKAPNRGEVEARIAELEEAIAVAAKAAGMDADGANRSESKKAVGGPSVARAPSGGGSAPILEPDLAGEAGDISPGDGLLDSSTRSPSAPRPASGDSDPLLRRPWFWVGVGAVVFAAGVGTFLLLGRDGTSVPPSALGNYKF